MSLNMSGQGARPLVSTSMRCGHNMTGWEQRMDRLYTYFYLLLFVPGLLLNTVALWVLCTHISKKTKAVIFMINLALADLAHVFSLPLRIYYYFTHVWPFGRAMCLLCFYLKYLNMYASIAFLVCISVQRCVFLLKPFCARQWRRRYDLVISFVVWVIVSLACSPFILMRNSGDGSARDIRDTYTSPSYPSFSPEPSSTAATTHPRAGCFKDLPMRRLRLPVMITMMALAELFGFLLPLAAISYSSVRIVHSLRQRQVLELAATSAPISPVSNPRRHCVLSSSSTLQSDRQTDGDKRRALRMVLSCSALFLICFAPYHINFLLYLMVSQDIVSHCATRLAVLQFHPVSLCLASLSCCLNPLLYYFLTEEFRQHLARRTSSFAFSFSSSLVSSPSNSQRPPLLGRPMSAESTSSCRE